MDNETTEYFNYPASNRNNQSCGSIHSTGREAAFDQLIYYFLYNCPADQLLSLAVAFYKKNRQATNQLYTGQQKAITNIIGINNQFFYAVRGSAPYYA